MKRFALIVIAAIAAVVVMAVVLLLLDVRLSTTNQGTGTTTRVKDTTYSVPLVRPTDGYSPACSRHVHKAGARHHIPASRVRRVDWAACHWISRPGAVTTVKVHSKGRAVYEGPLYRSTEHPQICGLTCGLWQATLDITWEHDNTWAGHVHVSCMNYSGIVVDFAIQQCASLRPGDAVVGWRRPYAVAQEQFELKTTIVWFTSEVHYQQSEHLYPSGRVTYQGGH